MTSWRVYTMGGLHMASKNSFSRALCAVALMAASLGTFAQDVVLNVSTTFGADKPQASEHRIPVGTEAAIYSGAMYRVMVKPVVKSETNVELSFKILDAASGAPVAAPTIHAQVGKVATYVYGRCAAARQWCVAQGIEAMEASNKLQLDVTPSL